jgi:hypothetical protein
LWKTKTTKTRRPKEDGINSVRVVPSCFCG